MIETHKHSLPALPPGVKPTDAVTVRVRPNHNLGGIHPAGSVLKMTAAEAQQAHRAVDILVEGEDPTPATPRSQIVSMTAAQALLLGLSVAPGEAVITFELMPWPADAAAKGQKRREELEALVQHLQAAGGDTEEVREFARIFGWDEDEEDGAAAYIKNRLPQIRRHFAEAQGAKEQAQDQLEALRAELRAHEERARADSVQLADDFQKAAEALRAKDAELKGVRETLTHSEGLLAAAREEIARLRAELEAKGAAAPPPAPDRGGPPPKGKRE